MPETTTVLRVRYPETDGMGIVHHTHYLVWFEIGRTELMREVGCSYAALERERGVYFPVIEAHARYRASARYDDLVTVQTRLVLVRRARVRFEYRVAHDGDGRLLAEGYTEHAAAGEDGRPRRMPEDLLRRLGGVRGDDGAE